MEVDAMEHRAVALRLVTIIAEPVLEERITRDLERLGARGYSVSEGRGRGGRGVRASDFGGANVRVDSVVSERIVPAILEHLAREYFPHYAVIAWVAEVTVVRGEKYV
jgi:nitrogen regulatory protein P-II 2